MEKRIPTDAGPARLGGAGMEAEKRRRVLLFTAGGLLVVGCLLIVGLVALLWNKREEPPVPAPVFTRPIFSMTENAFVSAFMAAGQTVRPNISLAPVVRKEGESALIAMYPVAGVQACVLNIATAKGEGKPYDIYITSESLRDAERIFDLLIRVLSPELSERDRLSVRVDLQLDGGPLPVDTLKTVRGGIKYQFSAMAAGVFLLGASPL